MHLFINSLLGNMGNIITVLSMVVTIWVFIQSKKKLFLSYSISEVNNIYNEQVIEIEFSNTGKNSIKKEDISNRLCAIFPNDSKIVSVNYINNHNIEKFSAKTHLLKTYEDRKKLIILTPNLLQTNESFKVELHIHNYENIEMLCDIRNIKLINRKDDDIDMKLRKTKAAPWSFYCSWISEILYS